MRNKNKKKKKKKKKKKHDITPPTLTKPSKTLFRKGFPKSTSTSRCGDSTVASKCACGILCTTKKQPATAIQKSSTKQQQQIGTDPNRSCSIWSIMRSKRASKASKQAKTEILMQKPSYLQAQRTDGSGLLVAKEKKNKTQRTDENLLDANCELEWAASEKSFLHVRECHAGKTKEYSIRIDTYCWTRGTYL